MRAGASLTIRDSTAYCEGNWTAPYLHAIEKQISGLAWPPDEIRFELSRLEALDTVGTWLLQRTMRDLRTANRRVSVAGASEQARRLLDIVAENSAAAAHPPGPYVPGFLEGIGRHSGSQLRQYTDLLAFIGRLAAITGQMLLRPWRIRGRLVFREVELAGLNSMPIVGLLAFLMGIVIAYQGGIVLRDYGANIYVADIVGLSMVRELAPLITAIIIAGRTGSAYTAQIGTMIVTEEVDALRSIGIVPMEMLVLPKLLALVIALPLLTVFADVMGIFGGLMMSSTMLDLNATTFMDRLVDALTLDSYLSGVGKAPVFAGIIATVGCFRGFQVFGSAESVGRQTTISVVESIFLVLVVDAVFSVAFSKLGI